MGVGSNLAFEPADSSARLAPDFGRRAANFHRFAWRDDREKFHFAGEHFLSKGKRAPLGGGAGTPCLALRTDTAGWRPPASGWFGTARATTAKLNEELRITNYE